MSVIYGPQGGGLISSFLPKLLSMAGTALGGPMGGMIGEAGGSLLTGQSPAGALAGYLADSNMQKEPEFDYNWQSQNPAYTPPEEGTPAFTGGPDYTERMEMNKAEAPAVTPRFDALVAQYGAKPEDDWTTRQQMQRGVPDSRTTRFNSWGAPSSAWDKHRGSWR